MADSIRVRVYTGDFETEQEVYVIGPFKSTMDRDEEIDRLYKLEGVQGDYDFSPSELTGEGADGHCTAKKSKCILTSDDLSRELFS